LYGGDDDLLQHVYNQTLGVSDSFLHFEEFFADADILFQFQKIFVINLPSRFDHRDSMSLAAAFSGLQVEYIDGVTGVSRDLLPPGGKEKNLKDGGLGAWRAHMNVLRR
jgi:hypothetical protein